MSEPESRIARRWVAVDTSAPVRHGSLETARICTARDGQQCELCRRVLPDARKRQRMRQAATRTSACTKGGVEGHRRCDGWKFASGNSRSNIAPRGAQPCSCGCHSDGRGKRIPTFEEWRERRAAELAEHERFIRERTDA